MTRNNGEARRRDASTRLRQAEVLSTDDLGVEHLAPDHVMLLALEEAFLRAALGRHSMDEMNFRAQVVAVLRRLDRRLRAMENRYGGRW